MSNEAARQVEPAVRYVALDLEMNQPSNKIIQVGVCAGHVGQPEDQFFVKSWLVDPGEAMNPEITRLTGITDEAIAQGGVSPASIYEELTKVYAHENTFMNPIVWGGGDSVLLKDYFTAAGIDCQLFGRRWMDVKTIASFLSMSQNPSKPKITSSLRSTMQKNGLKFLGQPHRADVDAFNTLRLFFALRKRQSNFETVAKLLRQN